MRSSSNISALSVKNRMSSQRPRTGRSPIRLSENPFRVRVDEFRRACHVVGVHRSVIGAARSLRFSCDIAHSPSPKSCATPSRAPSRNHGAQSSRRREHGTGSPPSSVCPRPPTRCLATPAEVHKRLYPLVVEGAVLVGLDAQLLKGAQGFSRHVAAIAATPVQLPGGGPSPITNSISGVPRRGQLEPPRSHAGRLMHPPPSCSSDIAYAVCRSGSGAARSASAEPPEAVRRPESLP